MAGEVAVDQASEGFKSFERDLRSRGTSTTRSRDDYVRIRSLVEAWFRSYRPTLVQVLGEADALAAVDDRLQDLRARVGSKIEIVGLRATLRAVARTIDRDLVPAYEVSRWSAATTQDDRAELVDGDDERYAQRLAVLDAGLADSWRQALADLSDARRLTYVGPVGEIREVFRAVLHRLAPDDDVRSEPWFRGHDGRPTQAERVRFIKQSRGLSDGASKTAGMIDERVGQIGRATYTRASSAFHAGTEQAEVQAVLLYVKAVMNELLPPHTNT